MSACSSRSRCEARGAQSTPVEPLDLQPGDLVQVRSPTEIAATLDQGGLNRGLNFDREMLPYCGRTFRVKDRVRRIIDDKTGRMLNIRQGLPHPRGCRLFGRAQPRSLVLSASDLPLLARGVASPRREPDRT